MVPVCPPSLLGFLSGRGESPVEGAHLYRKGLWSSRSAHPASKGEHQACSPFPTQSKILAFPSPVPCRGSLLCKAVLHSRRCGSVFAVRAPARSAPWRKYSSAHSMTLNCQRLLFCLSEKKPCFCVWYINVFIKNAKQLLQRGQNSHIC